MRLRYFYKINHKKEPIPGSNLRRKSRPKPFSQWLEILKPCCVDIDVNCYCGPRFFVQVDGRGNPVDGSLIKRTEWPNMSDGILYHEIGIVCCPPINGNFFIEGFGTGDEGVLCTGETVGYFMDTEFLDIGTTLYLSDRITKVTFTLFRDDNTGIVYILTDGVITGTTELTCSFNWQVSNTNIGPAVVSAVTVEDQALIYLGGVDFPIATDDTGQFSSNFFTPGLRTVKVTITGDVGAATAVTINDSATTFHSQPFTGNGTYTFPNVFVSGPNVDTFGPGISLV